MIGQGAFHNDMLASLQQTAWAFSLPSWSTACSMELFEASNLDLE